MGYIHGGRELPLVPFVFGTTQNLDIPRDRILRHIDLFFSGTLTGSTSSGSTVGAVITGGVADLITSVSVIGNGVTTLFSMDGRSLWEQNKQDSGVLPQLLDPVASTIGAKNINCFLRIPFENQLSINPSDTRLNAASFQSLTLKIQWAASADGTVYTSARTASDSMPSTDGITPFLVESTFPSVPSFLRLQEFSDLTITSANANLQHSLRLSKVGKYQRIGLKSDSDGAMNNAVIDSVTLTTGANIDHIGNWDWDMIQYSNQLRSGSAAISTGFSYLYLTEGGMWTTGLTTSDTNSCDLNLNVTSPGTTETVRVHTDFIQPIAR